MDAELKQKWIDALRSGEYKQTTDAALQREGAFCCLGVLCDLIDPDGWIAEARVDVRHHLGDYYIDNGEEFGLPRSVQEPLAKMNDDGTSFVEIADYIEANL